MLPIGPLMIEHRLMERMIVLLKKEAEWIERESAIHPEFIEAALDFIRTYADVCHHGKEENILLRELDRKPVSAEHRRIMEEILQEHRESRAAVADLEKAKISYLKGDREALQEIVRTVRFLVNLYPCHIEKEDHHFFLPCMEYFSQEEEGLMLRHEQEFDRDLVHRLYKEKVMREEARFGKP